MGRRFRQDGFGVLASLGGGIDPAHRQIRNRSADRSRQVSRWVSRAEIYRMPPVGEFDGDGGCDCRFTDAALPHRHYDTVPHLFEFVDQGRKGKPGMDRVGQVFVHRLANRRSAAEHTSEILHAHRSERQQRNLGSRKFRQIGRHAAASLRSCATKTPLRNNR
jgi:hypothetical protein